MVWGQVGKLCATVILSELAKALKQSAWRGIFTVQACAFSNLLNYPFTSALAVQLGVAETMKR